MRAFLANSLSRLARWIRPKAIPAALTGGQWSGTSFVDAWKRNRDPTPNELLEELKGIAWSCISLNTTVCANYPPALYVATATGQRRPKCGTRPLQKSEQMAVRKRKSLSFFQRKAETIEEVTDHPLINLLNQPTPPGVSLSSYDLWELTQTYLEVHGVCYWQLDTSALGIPQNIWILPAQNVTPKREANSRNIVDYYEYRTGAHRQTFSPEEIVFFKYADPRNPYTGGLSPLRAAWEQITLTSAYAATKGAVYDNQGIPSAILTPSEVMGEEERDRLEAQYNAKFRRGGAGKVLVAESDLKLQFVQHSLGDLAALAEMGATKELICNAFHVPIAFFTTNTNLANLQASQSQHMSLAIDPRLTRRDEKLNEALLPIYDPTGRLFLASEDPVPVDQQASILQSGQDLQYGVLTINEIRSGRGLPAVPWGDVPWLSTRWAPTDVPRTAAPGQSVDEKDPSANAPNAE
jgi:HK97 family phage portal protein